MNVTPLLLPIPDACRALGISRSKLYALVAAGELPIKKLGRKTLVPHADLVALADRLPVISKKAAA